MLLRAQLFDVLEVWSEAGADFRRICQPGAGAAFGDSCSTREAKDVEYENIERSYYSRAGRWPLREIRRVVCSFHFISPSYQPGDKTRAAR